MIISNTERKMLRLNLQFFGEDGGAGGAEAGGAPATAETPVTPETTKQPDPNAEAVTDERISKLVQSQVDRLMAEERKKSAELTQQIKALQKEKMTAEQIKQLEDEEREKSLAEREREVTRQRNLIHAQREVTKAGFGESMDAVVDFVMGENEETIEKRVKSFKSLVDRLVAAEVDKTFKANGRTPHGAGNPQEKKPDSIAEKLGKQRAEQAKKSSDIISLYTGGKK